MFRAHDTVMTFEISQHPDPTSKTSPFQGYFDERRAKNFQRVLHLLSVGRSFHTYALESSETPAGISEKEYNSVITHFIYDTGLP